MAGELIECPALVPHSLSSAGRALSSLGDAYCAYSWLRLGLEAAIQYAYYVLQGVGWEEALQRIARRSKGAASFTATMIKMLRGVHGSRRRWILRVYLGLGEWLHPSISVHRVGGRIILDEGLVREVLDAISYVCCLTGSCVSLDTARSCGLEKTRRLLLRRASSGKEG
jgi:hypothetical protein